MLDFRRLTDIMDIQDRAIRYCSIPVRECNNLELLREESVALNVPVQRGTTVAPKVQVYTQLAFNEVLRRPIDYDEPRTHNPDQVMYVQSSNTRQYLHCRYSSTFFYWFSFDEVHFGSSLRFTSTATTSR